MSLSQPNSHSIILKGVGSYLPEKVMTNHDLSRIVETSDEWIRSRTGITERRIAADTEYTSDMAVQAAQVAIKNANIQKEAIDLLIVGTMTPDKVCPATATIVQHKLGLKPLMAFDVQAACSGYLYIQEVALAFLKTGRYHNALIIGAEKLSTILDWSDRTTCVLFGDGAGAVVLSTTPEPGVGILHSILQADGQNAEILQIPAGGVACPASIESIQNGGHFLKMNGKEVFRFAVRMGEQICLQLLRELDLKTSDIHHVVAHQANIRILQMLAERLNVPISRFICNLDKVGNTSAASIPLALDEGIRSRNIHPGELVLLIAFGGGLTWGASLIKWHSS